MPSRLQTATRRNLARLGWGLSRHRSPTQTPYITTGRLSGYRQTSMPNGTTTRLSHNPSPPLPTQFCKRQQPSRHKREAKPSQRNRATLRTSIETSIILIPYGRWCDIKTVYVRLRVVRYWRSTAVNEVKRSVLSTSCDGRTGLTTLVTSVTLTATKTAKSTVWHKKTSELNRYLEGPEPSRKQYSTRRQRQPQFQQEVSVTEQAQPPTVTGFN